MCVTHFMWLWCMSLDIILCQSFLKTTTSTLWRFTRKFPLPMFFVIFCAQAEHISTNRGQPSTAGLARPRLTHSASASQPVTHRVAPMATNERGNIRIHHLFAIQHGTYTISKRRWATEKYPKIIPTHPPPAKRKRGNSGYRRFPPCVCSRRWQGWIDKPSPATTTIK